MYVELHARSAFSFLTGSSLPEDLVGTCADLSMPAMAMLDRDNVSGAVRFHLAAQKAGVRAHIGAEITSTDVCLYPLLAESQKGYQNLCRLISHIKLRAKKGEGAATLEDFAEYSEGLICLTGDAYGPLAQALKNGKGAECVERLKSIFGKNNVYAELQRHFNREEEVRNQEVISIARSQSLPLLATNGINYATPEARELQDVLTCVRHKVKIVGAGKLLAPNSERFIKNSVEMAWVFGDLPEAIANTSELSSRLQFTLADLGYQFPRYPVPSGETMNSFLRKRTDEGARRHYRPYTERAKRQIERELTLIEKLDLAGYFLIVWDIVEFCRARGILVQGRGSAANSAVCYSLGITAVDPIAMDLLFERFLSEERGEWPDIDLDLPSGDDREQAIQYVYQIYGERGAAMTANVITYRGRSAVRDIGKVLGFEQDELNRLSKLVPSWGWTDPEEIAGERFREAGFSPDNPMISKFLELYLKILDLPRHLGQHSGGMVICQGALDSVVPLEPATMPGRVIVQWDKDDCANVGIVKVDLLGLGMMAALRDTINLIHDHYGEDVDLAHLPPDDPLVYKTLQRADTIGLFQVESRAQMSCLPRLWPTKFYDLVVQVAIIRPGPIVGQMLNPYLLRRQGREKPECLHPSLEPVLARTLGVPIFQEQLLRMAMIVSGFSGGEAEELRRAFGFKRAQSRMQDVEEKLRRGMDKNNISGHVQDVIVKSITSFALYGFPESHAASFALIAYASAYLKCHYLAAFTAAILNNQPMGFYSSATLIKDAQRHGLHFKPVDITQSDWPCTIEEDEGKKWLRLGFNYVRGMRREHCDEIVYERTRRPFHSIQDLTRRVPVLRKDEIRKLSQIGALNFIQQESGMHRRDALWESERAIRKVGPLFESVGQVDERSPLSPMTDDERLRADVRGTGVTIGKHPIAYHRERLNAMGVTPANRLSAVRNGSHVRIAGCVICRQRPGTAKGLLFMSIEDETGISNAVVMPDLFDECRLTILGNNYLFIEGMIQNMEGAISIKANRVSALQAAEVAFPSHDFR
jgi:error-prone DNA polymerase